DLALAPDTTGAEVWASQGIFARGVSLGAPPDAWNHKGQNWALPPYDPRALAAAGFAPYAEVIRASMSHGAALRIDHVMGLELLFWIPEGASATEGGYVHYPSRELFAVLALESHRQRCAVI